MWLPHEPAPVAVSEAVDTGTLLSPNQVEPTVDSSTASSRQKLCTRNLDCNLAHGDPLCVNKPEHLTRLVVQNTNGFQLVDSNGGTFQVAMHTLARLGTDIAAFSEINLDTQSHHVKRKLHNAMKSTTTHYKVAHSSSDFRTRNEYKPGGTITAVCNNLAGRVETCGSDSFGRWSHVTLNCRGNCKITLVTIYQPCKGPKWMEA